jgi:hypothetical protein
MAAIEVAVVDFPFFFPFATSNLLILRKFLTL